MKIKIKMANRKRKSKHSKRTAIANQNRNQAKHHPNSNSNHQTHQNDAYSYYGPSSSEGSSRQQQGGKRLRVSQPPMVKAKPKPMAKPHPQPPQPQHPPRRSSYTPYASSSTQPKPISHPNPNLNPNLRTNERMRMNAKMNERASGSGSGSSNANANLPLHVPNNHRNQCRRHHNNHNSGSGSGSHGGSSISSSNRNSHNRPRDDDDDHHRRHPHPPPNERSRPAPVVPRTSPLKLRQEGIRSINSFLLGLGGNANVNVNANSDANSDARKRSRRRLLHQNYPDASAGAGARAKTGEDKDKDKNKDKGMTGTGTSGREGGGGRVGVGVGGRGVSSNNDALSVSKKRPRNEAFSCIDKTTKTDDRSENEHGNENGNAHSNANANANANTNANANEQTTTSEDGKNTITSARTNGTANANATNGYSNANGNANHRKGGNEEDKDKDQDQDQDQVDVSFLLLSSSNAKEDATTTTTISTTDPNYNPDAMSRAVAAAAAAIAESDGRHSRSRSRRSCSSSMVDTCSDGGGSDGGSNTSTTRSGPTNHQEEGRPQPRPPSWKKTKFSALNEYLLQGKNSNFNSNEIENANANAPPKESCFVDLNKHLRQTATTTATTTTTLAMGTGRTTDTASSTTSTQRKAISNPSHNPEAPSPSSSSSLLLSSRENTKTSSHDDNGGGKNKSDHLDDEIGATMTTDSDTNASANANANANAENTSSTSAPAMDMNIASLSKSDLSSSRVCECIVEPTTSTQDQQQAIDIVMTIASPATETETETEMEDTRLEPSIISTCTRTCSIKTETLSSPLLVPAHRDRLHDGGGDDYGGGENSVNVAPPEEVPTKMDTSSSPPLEQDHNHVSPNLNQVAGPIQEEESRNNDPHDDNNVPIAKPLEQEIINPSSPAVEPKSKTSDGDVSPMKVRVGAAGAQLKEEEEEAEEPEHKMAKVKEETQSSPLTGTDEHRSESRTDTEYGGFEEDSNHPVSVCIKQEDTMEQMFANVKEEMAMEDDDSNNRIMSEQWSKVKGVGPSSTVLDMKMSLKQLFLVSDSTATVHKEPELPKSKCHGDQLVTLSRKCEDHEIHMYDDVAMTKNRELSGHDTDPAPPKEQIVGEQAKVNDTTCSPFIVEADSEQGKVTAECQPKSQSVNRLTVLTNLGEVDLQGIDPNYDNIFCEKGGNEIITKEPNKGVTDEKAHEIDIEPCFENQDGEEMRPSNMKGKLATVESASISEERQYSNHAKDGNPTQKDASPIKHVNLNGAEGSSNGSGTDMDAAGAKNSTGKKQVKTKRKTPSKTKRPRSISMSATKSISCREEAFIHAPREQRASTLLRERTYILFCMSRFLHKNEMMRMTDIYDILHEDKGTNPQFMHHPLNITRRIVRALLDAMGFECHRECDGDKMKVRPMKGKKPSQSAGSVREFIHLQISAAKQEEQPMNCNCSMMEEISLAYRLGAHFALRSCDGARRRTSKEKGKTTKIGEVAVNAMLTLIVSLRGVLVDLFREVEDRMEEASNLTAVAKNIYDFFNKSCSEDFTAVEMLLIDCIPLLTEVSAEQKLYLGEKRSDVFAQNILKFDGNSRKKRVASESLNSGISDGLMELFFRQLLCQESCEAIRPIRKYLQKLNSRNNASHGALASILDSATGSCHDVVERIANLRRYQRNFMKSEAYEQIFCHAKSFANLSSAQGTDRDENILLIDGCIFLSSIIDILKHQQDGMILRRPVTFSQLRKIEQMAYFYFHTLMENQFDNGGGVEALSLQRPDNIPSAVLSALMLAGKVLDSQISLRRLMELAQQASKQKHGKKREKPTNLPCKKLIKSYEQQLMISFGYVGHNYCDLPVSRVHRLGHILALDEGCISQLERLFEHRGYTHSALCLLEDPDLVVFSLYHFGSEKLGRVKKSLRFDKLFDDDEKRTIRLLSNHMMNVFRYTQQKMQVSPSATPEFYSIESVSAPSLSKVMDMINCNH